MTPRHFAWQAWPSETFTFVLRGRRDTYGTGWRAWTGLVADDAGHFAWQAWHSETFTVVLRGQAWALGHMNLCFALQAWTYGTVTFVLRGRCGTYGTGWRAWTGLVAGDAAHFAWQAWRSETFSVVLRGRRGTYGTGWRAWTGLVAGDAAALCVAGVAIDVLVDVFLLWVALAQRGKRLRSRHCRG